MYAGVAMDVLLAKSEGAREAVSPGGCLTVIKERASFCEVPRRRWPAGPGSPFSEFFTTIIGRKCARSCAPLRNFLRTWLQSLQDVACRAVGSRILRSTAQLLAHNGPMMSLTV